MQKEEKRCSVYDKNTELIRMSREGDPDAAEELCELNRPLVYSIAARFRDRGVDFEELVGAGSLGLVKAINSFDPSRGCAFSTYATPLIFGEIRRFLRDDGIIRVSREQKKLAAALGRERERRLFDGERTDIESIAAAVGVSRADAAAAFFATVPPRSLDESVGEEDSHTLADLVCDDGAEERDFEHLAVNMAIERLSDFHRKIVILRFFRDLSQVEVADIMGLSQVKVSREEKKILAILRCLLS